MEFILFVATDPEAEPYDPDKDNVGDWVADLQSRGAHLHGDRLRPVEDATLVRRRNGEVIVTDGPFTESKEWIAGYDVIECADIDEAVEIASRHPMARFGRIEVRAAWPIEGLAS